jgi:hypothetical protein
MFFEGSDRHRWGRAALVIADREKFAVISHYILEFGGAPRDISEILIGCAAGRLRKSA